MDSPNGPAERSPSSLVSIPSFSIPPISLNAIRVVAARGGHQLTTLHGRDVVHDACGQGPCGLRATPDQRRRSVDGVCRARPHGGVPARPLRCPPADRALGTRLSVPPGDDQPQGGAANHRAAAERCAAAGAHERAQHRGPAALGDEPAPQPDAPRLGAGRNPECRKLAPGGDVVTCLPCAEGACCGCLRRRRRSPKGLAVSRPSAR